MMKKRVRSIVLAVVMILSLLPAPAFAAEAKESLPDWYFLFAIFKNVDADVGDRKGVKTHVTYTMSQNEVDTIKAQAQAFENYMTQTGVMRAHVDVVEIDATLTELYNRDNNSSYIGAAQAAPLLKDKVDLDRYDHVACIFSTDVQTGYLGISSSTFENGTGHSCINLMAWERQQAGTGESPEAIYTHEFLHFMERMCAKWDVSFVLHDVEKEFYGSDLATWYDDLIRNRAKGNAGTGVAPFAWQYPPHVLRTMTELTVPSGVTGIAKSAFSGYTSLTRVTIPSSVTSVDIFAFASCTALTSVFIADGVASIGGAAFQGCSNLTSISLPASITRVEQYTFANSGLKDVYYSGTEAQWEAVEISSISNGSLRRATIHYNSLLADVKTDDWFGQSVAWALGEGITNGTGDGNFSPNITCSQAQILTFLWRAKGEPEPSGAAAGSEFYAKAVQWAKEQGLAGGAFDPNAPCTRADAVVYLWKLAGSPGAGSPGFSDVPAGAGYARAVAWAVEKGVTKGTSKTEFSPNDACTRGQIVTFLYRALA